MPDTWQVALHLGHRHAGGDGDGAAISYQAAPTPGKGARARFPRAPQGRDCWGVRRGGAECPPRQPLCGYKG